MRLLMTRDLFFTMHPNNEASLDDESQVDINFLERLSLNLWLKCAIRSRCFVISNKNGFREIWRRNCGVIVCRMGMDII